MLLKRCNCFGALKRCLTISSGRSNSTSVMTGAELLNLYRSIQDEDLAGAVVRSPTSASLAAGSTREIFANSEVHLDKISVFGFDFDYTLASYRNTLQTFIYEEARNHLVDKLGYPSALKHVFYDKSFPIRGLSFDLDTGLLYKLGPNFRVDFSTVFRGREKLEADAALRALGGDPHRRQSEDAANLRGIFDLFSLAEACLLADVIQVLRTSKFEFSPSAVFSDVSSSIGLVHRSGKMHSAVTDDVEKFIHPNPKLGPLLSRIRASGRQTFLLTNSSFRYVDACMKFLIGEEDWRDLFHVIIVDGEKPKFYTSRNKFRRLNLKEGRMEWTSVKSFESGKVYSKGNVEDLMRLTGWEGSELLYIGDQIFTDLGKYARLQGWWTGAIIREMEKEIEVEKKPDFQILSVRLSLIEEILRRIQWLPEGGILVQDSLRDLEKDRAETRNKMNAFINKNFGSAFFSSAHSPSLYSDYVLRYSDLVTARLENVLEYDLNYRFYPRKKRTLPHDPVAKAEIVSGILQKKAGKTLHPRDVQLREKSFSYEDD